MNAAWGEFFSLAAAVTWAVGVILYRQLGARLPPLTLNFLKNLLVLAALLPLLWAGGEARWPALRTADVLLALGSGAIGIAVADTLYFRALNALGAARMGILGNSYSPMVVALGVTWLGERLNPQQWLGFVLVSAGVWLVLRPDRERPAAAAPDAFPEAVSGARREAAASPPRRGAAIGVVSVLLMAVSVVMLKPTLESQPLLPVTVLRMLGALAGMLALAAWRGGIGALWPAPHQVPWRRLALAALVGQGLSMLCWLAGYQRIDAAVAAILNETASVFILLLAWFWLGERPGRREWAGVALTFGGVACMLSA